MGNTSINMRRVSSRISELFLGFINMSDFPDDISKHFETRALAALALMMKTGLDVQQSSLYITDGYNDMGIDAIYLDESQKKLFVIQSKWRTDGNSAISQAEMCSFVEGLKRILNLELDGANASIIAKTSDIDEALTKIGYQISAIFIHTGNCVATDYVLRPMNELLKNTNDDISTILTFEEISFADVYSYLAKGQEQDNIVIDDVILNNWGKIDSPYCAYYGMISAAAIGEWYKTFGNALFAKNIRFYKGNTEVNEGIKKALLQEPEKFFYYNNGIKLLCNAINRKAKDSTTNVTGLFALDGVSLVNGAQTAGTIGTVFLENPDQVAKASVMIQIIDLSHVEENTAVQITKLSNTQNRIDNKDFVALDPQQERIRTELLFSHYAYLYKSGDKITDSNSQISFDEAIVALACCYEDVTYATLAKRNIGALSEDISKPPYKLLMNSSTNAFALLNCTLALRETEKYLTIKRGQTIGKQRLVCVHGNRFIVHCALQKIKQEVNFKKSILDNTVIQNIVVSVADTCIPLITDAINEFYQDSYPANIFKNGAKCKKIKEYIDRGGN